MDAVLLMNTRLRYTLRVSRLLTLLKIANTWMSGQVAQLTSPVEGISCHAWSSDGDQLALSPNNNELYIYTGTLK
jgi:hypothetical protein